MSSCPKTCVFQKTRNKRTLKSNFSNNTYIQQIYAAESLLLVNDTKTLPGQGNNLNMIIHVLSHSQLYFQVLRSKLILHTVLVVWRYFPSTSQMVYLHMRKTERGTDLFDERQLKHNVNARGESFLKIICPLDYALTR